MAAIERHEQMAHPAHLQTRIPRPNVEPDKTLVVWREFRTHVSPFKSDAENKNVKEFVVYALQRLRAAGQAARQPVRLEFWVV